MDDVVRLEARLRELESEQKNAKENNALLSIELEDTKRLLDYYRLISDFAHDWEMWYNPDGSINYVSPSFKDITGFAPMELTANINILNNILYPEDRDSYYSFINDSLNFVRLKKTLRFRILTQTKQIRWCEIKCRAIYDKKGKYLGQMASISDITNLMKALGQIKDLSEGKSYEVKAREKIRRELESKERELVSFLMEISQKNETLQYARKQLDQLVEKSDKDSGKILKQVIVHIQSALHTSGSWDNFRKYFEQINPDFFRRLKESYPDLSEKDLKICSYLRLGLSTKEIAVLQNITFESAEISRVRLRKKLSLTRNINLTEFITKI